MKFVMWVVSVVIIVAGCLLVYRYIRNSEKANEDYFSLLRALRDNPDDFGLKSQIYTSGRKYYKNRLTGIDASIEHDIQEALSGQVISNLETFADQ